jgi:hypothetical protein
MLSFAEEGASSLNKGMPEGSFQKLPEDKGSKMETK